MKYSEVFQKRLAAIVDSRKKQTLNGLISLHCIMAVVIFTAVTFIVIAILEAIWYLVMTVLSFLKVDVSNSYSYVLNYL